MAEPGERTVCLLLYFPKTPERLKKESGIACSQYRSPPLKQTALVFHYRLIYRYAQPLRNGHSQADIGPEEVA